MGRRTPQVAGAVRGGLDGPERTLARSRWSPRGQAMYARYQRRSSATVLGGGGSFR
jgi:hypothetical protein